MDLFDIIGPIMIGPSSSHTAGAARIGRVARRLLGERVMKAEIGFHGSFAKTWQGHGTDRAVIGGLLDLEVDDVRLRESLTLAVEMGMDYVFNAVNLRDAHPNTVVIEAWGQSGRHLTLRAASIGGGNIMVQSLDGLEVNFSGKENTLIIRHLDAPGAIAQVSGLLARSDVNIATMRVFRAEAGGAAIMALETDSLPSQDTVEALRSIPGISSVTLLERR